MQLSIPRMLSAWEASFDELPAGKAVNLLEATLPGTDRGTVLDLPLGRREAMLAELRRTAFGSKLEAVSECPSCGRPMEVDVPLEALPNVVCGDQALDYELRSGEYAVKFRLPRSLDMLRLDSPIEAARRSIFEACVIEASRAGEAIGSELLPEDVVSAVEAAMSEADPLADVSLLLQCPECGHEFEALLDLGVIVWAEIDSWARRTLQDVHTLASAYGWSETEVLALSPRRRAIYVRMACS